MDTHRQMEKYSEADLRRYFGSAKKGQGLTKTVLYFMIGFICLSLISPFIPPKSQRGNWIFSKNIDAYILKVKDFLYLYALIVLLISFVAMLESGRRKVDRLLGYKLVATRKISRVIPLPNRKLLMLNNWIPFVLKERQLNFQNVKSGQSIQTIRTGTFRLLQYNIYD
ncbi:hypothetical protein [Dyadobacter sp. LHD-138]|uniref:hypothetical protein n=1 Tax=Dyadobacter sp. LHD-138 TaxID=3071413 RepID=UPI0027E0E59D|nr:hypothetical protein [Dyadobacter sp. LHD-138]MDQ6479474.1 hypothetical protein [Dyadobacter sp. LHD-138]